MRREGREGAVRLRGGGSSGSAGPPPDPKAVTQPRGLGGEGHEPALLVFIYFFFSFSFITLYFFNFFFFPSPLTCVAFQYVRHSSPPALLEPHRAALPSPQEHTGLSALATAKPHGLSPAPPSSIGAPMALSAPRCLSHTFIPPYPVMECDFGRPGASCSRLAPVAAQFSM